MATANVNIDLPMLSLEDNAINKFVKLINIHKTQITTRFRQLNDTLFTKQTNVSLLTNLINKLDNLLTDVRPLLKAREQVKTELTHNKLNTVLECTLKQLQDRINKLDIPTVDIKWDTSKYSKVVNNICKVEIGKLSSYSDRTQPIWSTVSKGMGQNQLYTPHGLAVDQDSGNIYVADSVAHRIQIYDSIGEYVRTIKTENYYPSRILLDTEYCYVSFAMNIIKINKITGKIISSVAILCNSYINRITGICLDVLDRNSIFMCKDYSSIVLVYNKTDLKETNSIKLNTQYYYKTYNKFTETTSPRDIKLLPAEMIILFTHTKYPLQCFNREGVLLRTIISNEQIRGAEYFCIDLYNNYIISAKNDNNIKIFTPSGKLITSIGKPGQAIGQFKDPQGICLDLNNRIIICDRKDNYKLQAF